MYVPTLVVHHQDDIISDEEDMEKISSDFDYFDYGIWPDKPDSIMIGDDEEEDEEQRDKVEGSYRNSVSRLVRYGTVLYGTEPDVWIICTVPYRTYDNIPVSFDFYFCHRTLPYLYHYRYH